jgi:hypothetical protein
MLEPSVLVSQAKKGAARVQFAEVPRKEPWGGWAAFKDSEGNVHGLHSPPANA